MLSSLHTLLQTSPTHILHPVHNKNLAQHADKIFLQKIQLRLELLYEVYQFLFHVRPYRLMPEYDQKIHYS